MNSIMYNRLDVWFKGYHCASSIIFPVSVVDDIHASLKIEVFHFKNVRILGVTHI